MAGCLAHGQHCVLGNKEYHFEQLMAEEASFLNDFGPLTIDVQLILQVSLEEKTSRESYTVPGLFNH